MTAAHERPTIALTLGDAAGIGAELIARLLARPQTLRDAHVVLVADPWLWEEGQRVAGVRVDTVRTDTLARHALDRPALLAVGSVAQAQVTPGRSGAAAGAAELAVLDRCTDAVARGDVDAICFAPLNKYAMKLGGLKFDDEMHHFADRLGVTGYFCEFNTLDGLWTSRISSHVPMRDVPRYVERGRIVQAARLIDAALREAGTGRPRVAVAGFNPHNGDGGTCGREEIDVIAPAVADLRAEGVDAHGPFPADTIFLRARDGEFDAVVTMYHDQGQIAIKLLGFSRGVTVQGGLPVPITTPAHGTAYDIVGQGKADVQATANAFDLAVRMATARRRRARAR